MAFWTKQQNVAATMLHPLYIRLHWRAEMKSILDRAVQIHLSLLLHSACYWGPRPIGFRLNDQPTMAGNRYSTNIGTTPFWLRFAYNMASSGFPWISGISPHRKIWPFWFASVSFQARRPTQGFSGDKLPHLDPRAYHKIQRLKSQTGHLNPSLCIRLRTVMMGMVSSLMHIKNFYCLFMVK